MKLNPERLAEALVTQGLTHFCGVPDSVLAGCIDSLESRLGPDRQVICPSEGTAVAHAMAVALATGRPACVYLQNSGLGNAFNPLVSFASRRVAGIPMVLLIGWRGAPEEPDEPQHLHQGAILLPMLDLLEIPYRQLSPGTVDEDVAWAVRTTVDQRNPAALIVRRSLLTERAQVAPEAGAGLARRQVIEATVERAPAGTVFVATTGYTARELDEVAERRCLPDGSVLLVVGAMGHAGALARTLSSLLPIHPVVCLDGDGAALMHLGAFALARRTKTDRFVHVLLGNGTHDSVGGQPISDPAFDFGALARHCGYTRVAHVDSAATLAAALAAAFVGSGPSFLDVRIQAAELTGLRRPRYAPARNVDDFMAQQRTGT